MPEAILPTQAIEQEDHQIKDWSPAKVTYTVLMALTLISHLWMMLIGSGIDNIPTYIWIIRLLTVPFAICLGKLWKDRGFQILSAYFLLFFLRCFIPNPGSIFSVEVAESIPSSLWLFAGCYGLAKILTQDQLKRFLTANYIVWIAGIAVLSCLGIYVMWTEQPIHLLGGVIDLFTRNEGVIRLNLVYLATTSGVMLGVTLLIGTIMIICINKKLFRIILFLLMIPITIAMALTDSRTAFISVSAGMAIMAFSGLYKCCQKKVKQNAPHDKVSQWKIWILGILVMAVVFAVLIVIFLQITPAFNRIRTQGVIPRALAEETKKTDVASRGFTSDNILTGRTELWSEIINYISQNKYILLTGVTKHAPLVAINSFYGHSHCLYLQVLLESGIPGLLFVLAFVVHTAINAIRAVTNPELPLWIRLLSVICISLPIADLVECFLWLRASQAPITVVFFIVAGILNTYIPNKAEKRKKPVLNNNKSKPAISSYNI